MPLVMLAESVEEDFTFVVSDGTAVITGYSGPGGDLVLPASLGGYPVTTIGFWAFSENTSITSVEMPDSVTLIDMAAFEHCTNLTSVTIGNNVTSIGHFAFRHCRGLTSLTIPDSVISISGWAFAACSNLLSVKIGNGVTSIGNRAFQGCRSLEAVDIPDNVTTIADAAFQGCLNLASAVFRGNAPVLGPEVFSYTASDFAIFYFDGKSGFDSPNWQNYPIINLGISTPYTDWLVAGQVLNAHYSGPTTDLNGDGVSLLMAYSLNLNPLSILSACTPEVFKSDKLWAMSFFGDQPDINYSVESSTNLTDWTTQGVSLSVPDAQGIRTATVSMNGDNSLFLRLVVEKPD